MLEILSHQYLKRFIRSNEIDWDHIYSFGRIVSKCLQTNETYLINSEIFSTNIWLPALLISIFLFEENSTFVLSQDKIEFLKNLFVSSFPKIDCIFLKDILLGGKQLNPALRDEAPQPTFPASTKMTSRL